MSGGGRPPDDQDVGSITQAVADTTRQDLLVASARRQRRDEAFSGLDDEEVSALVCTGAAEIAAATARWLAALAELVVRGVWADDGSRSPAAWLSWACGMAPSTAREHLRVAVRLRDCPLVAERFAAGRLSYSKVRAITRICEPATEAMLVTWADAATAAELERIIADTRRLQRASAPCAERDDLGVRTRWRDDGTFELVLRTDAATGTQVEQHLDRLVELSSQPDGEDEDERRGSQPELDPSGSVIDDTAGEVVAASRRATRTARAAEAVVGALAAAVAGAPVDSSGADRHTVVLVAPAAAVVDPDAGAEGDLGTTTGADVVDDREQRTPGVDLRRSRGADRPAASTDGRVRSATLVRDGRGGLRAMSARQLRRMACTATVALRTTIDDSPVDLGRSRREPDVRLRRLLVARDGGSCRFPGCGARMWLHAHHVVHWADGGPTDLDNLVLLCSHHHRLVHAQQWDLRPAGRGRWTFHPPSDATSGSRTDPGARTAQRPGPGASAETLRQVASAHGPDLDPRSLRPPDWDGFGYDHDLTVGVLLERSAA